MAPPTGGPGFPGTEGKFGPGPMGSNFGRPQIPAALQEFHNCSAECMKNAMAPCFTGYRNELY